MVYTEKEKEEHKITIRSGEDPQSLRENIRLLAKEIIRDRKQIGELIFRLDQIDETLTLLVDRDRILGMQRQINRLFHSLKELRDPEFKKNLYM